MSKIWRVAKTEYLNLVRTKAFVISIVLMPVFMGGAILVQALLQDKQDVTDRRLAVVDRSGRLHAALEKAAEVRNAAVVEEGKKVRPRFLPLASEEDEEELSARVRRGEIFAYVVIGADVLDGGADAEVAYHSQSPTYLELAKWAGEVLNEEVRRLRYEGAGIDRGIVERLNRRVPMRRFGLVEVTAGGERKQAERVNELTTFLVPAVAMFLLFALVMMAAPQLLNNILEEKIQRISEILVASVSPMQLFCGKLLGTVFVSWTLSALYLGGALYVAHHFGIGGAIPPSLVAWFLFYQLMALFIFGSIFSAFGAACSELRDAQSLMTPAMLIVMVPMFVWMPVLRNPDSSFAIGLSLIPPLTPFLMLLRIAVEPGPALWEVLAAVVLTAGFTLACVWAASKIFRIGILAQGQAPSFRRLISWVLSR